MDQLVFKPPGSLPSSAGSASSDSDKDNELEVDTGSDEPFEESVTPPRTPTKTVPPKSPVKTTPGKRRSRTTSLSATKSAARVVTSGNRTIYTAGRPPWYNSQGELKEAFVIGLCGGSASGKTTVAKKIIEALDVQWVSVLSMDSFYKVLTKEQHEEAARNEYNFDHPDSFDFDLMVQTLRRLKYGKRVDVPIYNFQTHAREKEKKTLYGANVVIFEGIMTFCNKQLLELMDMKIFVDTDSDVRLARRLKRDITERGREIEGVLKQYHKFVKPAYDHYIAPTMVHADIIVPRGGENKIALNLIVTHVHNQLQQRGFMFRSKLANAQYEGQPLPSTLYVLENTSQVKGLHTFIRNKKTSRDEFIFYSKRLMRLLIEYALSMLPHKKVVVDTPQGIPYEGMKLDDSKVKKVCGVSILRAGETIEPALTEVLKDIRLGKILIQTNLDTGEPELHYVRLPKDIKDYHVILSDATVATGAAAMMAIRVLLDHDVQEENIMFLSLVMAAQGVHTVAYAFPKVKIISTAVDPDVNEDFHILPGIGNFGDRYFGTEL
ncbi:uridine-cytidine kinase-like 1 [Lingula anatina]|uniref:Uridine kinase n=1 Tax=Lingula anatina TaxID=7574 RepID=A0A1S3J2R4_LINAN|nr:uridine-cytidine kinase-like 1 [Lingula anatina]|eukprot:XP_013404707.1 uridine-cytidine kinase-like 1 [Lingula anatina]